MANMVNERNAQRWLTAAWRLKETAAFVSGAAGFALEQGDVKKAVALQALALNCARKSAWIYHQIVVNCLPIAPNRHLRFPRWNGWLKWFFSEIFQERGAK